MKFFTLASSRKSCNRIIKLEPYRMTVDAQDQRTHLSLVVNVVEILPGLRGRRLTLDVADAPNTAPQ